MQSDKLAALARWLQALPMRSTTPCGDPAEDRMMRFAGEEDFQKSKNIEEFKTSIRKIESMSNGQEMVTTCSLCRRMEPRWKTWSERHGQADIGSWTTMPEQQHRYPDELNPDLPIIAEIRHSSSRCS